MLKKLLLSLIILSMSLLLFAQTANSASTMSSSSAYSYDGNRSGVEKLKMNVYILGRVSKPGLYLVPDDTDFLTLLALAGGPLEDAKLSRITITRKGSPLSELEPAFQDTISASADSLFAVPSSMPAKSGSAVTVTNPKKEIPTPDGEIITINFRKYLETGNVYHLKTVNDLGQNTTIPLQLQPGDTVMVGGEIWYWFGKVADILSKAAIALSVYNLITNL
mgnify:CR=1 FL=1|jgi:hypothetical protein